MKSAKTEPVRKGKIEWAVYLGGDEGGKREELGKGGKREYEVKQVICLELFGGTCWTACSWSVQSVAGQRICCCCGCAGVGLALTVGETGTLPPTPVRDLPEEWTELPNKSLVNSLISKLWRVVVFVTTARELGRGERPKFGQSDRKTSVSAPKSAA